MPAWYNEPDKYCAEWLRNLISTDLIAPGVVDERLIQDIRPSDLTGFDQHHFFAGLGGWSYALRLSGVPDNRPLWTGSCPCQPFSAAGQGIGFTDERHLWPYWHHLIRVYRPSTILGEQVASPAGLGWLDLVQADLEGEGYAVGSADLCAAGVGAPHIRQRLWFVAHADSERRTEHALLRQGPQGNFEAAGSGITCNDCHGTGWTLPNFAANFTVPCKLCGGTGRMAEPECEQHARSGGARRGRRKLTNSRTLVHAEGKQVGLPGCARQPRGSNFWSDCDWLPCTDGKARPVRSGSFPLAFRVPARISKLRAIGNSICPQVAAKFIKEALS